MLVLRNLFAISTVLLPRCYYDPEFLPEDSEITSGTATTSGSGTSVGSSPTTSDGKGGSDGENSTSAATATPGDSSTSSGIYAGTTADGTSQAPEETLCERLGGFDGISILAQRISDHVIADIRISAFFMPSSVNLNDATNGIADAIREAAECPGSSPVIANLAAKHEGKGIIEIDYQDFLEDLEAAALDFQANDMPTMTDADRAWLLVTAQGWQTAIASGPKSLYHDLDRYPGLKALAEETLPALLKDETISGFFDALETDFVACLARAFVEHAGGPAIYKSNPAPWEQSPPDCHFVREASVDYDPLKEGPDPIELTDFIAFLAAIQASAAAASLDPPDVQKLTAALWPLCERIISKPNECPGNKGPVEAFDAVLPNGFVPLSAQNGKYDGTLATMMCVKVSIPENETLKKLGDVWLTLDVQHQWAGELTFKLVHPQGTVVRAMHRPGGENGYPLLPEPGTKCPCGTPANFKAKNLIHFRDGQMNPPAFEIGKGLAFDQDIPSGTFMPDTPFSDLKGKLAAGEWSVCVGDTSDGMTNMTNPGDLLGAKIEIVRVKF